MMELLTKSANVSTLNPGSCHEMMKKCVKIELVLWFICDY